jgi:hypothetical protein
MAILQTAISPYYRRNAMIQIDINGQNVTDKLDPHLISVRVTLKRLSNDDAHIELDDRDGSLLIPPVMAPVKILMGWANSGPSLPLSPAQSVGAPSSASSDGRAELPYRAGGMQLVFAGQINSVESGFSRSAGGRRLWIDANSASFGMEKQPSLNVLGAGEPGDGSEGEQIPLPKFMSTVLGKIGYSFVGANLDNITEKMWVQDNESAGALARRIAVKYGLSFKIIGNTVFMSPPKFMPNGNSWPTVEAEWGKNLINWRIKPFSTRADWAGAQQRFFDVYNGLWKKVASPIGGDYPFGVASAVASLPGAAPNSRAGTQTNDAMGEDARQGRGTGSATINGEPAAQPNGILHIVGARPGVDGSYRITEAEHNYSRGSGYTTRCSLDSPLLNSNDYETQAEMEQRGERMLNDLFNQPPVFPWAEGAQVVPPELAVDEDGGIGGQDENGENWRPWVPPQP